MAKYSTGSGGSSGGGDACELCGTATETLVTASVAGATLEVCQSCAPHDDAPSNTEDDSQDQSDRDEVERRKRAAQNVARARDAAGGDSSHWEEEGTNYEADSLPYLVSGYGERVESARQEAGFQREELATELDVSENDLLAIEQGRATRADVGGSLIQTLEDRLDIELAQE